MTIAVIVFLLVIGLIATERVHRTKVAMAGAGAVVVLAGSGFA